MGVIVGVAGAAVGVISCCTVTETDGVTVGVEVGVGVGTGVGAVSYTHLTLPTN